MIFSFLKKHWVLVVILAIGLFLRTYDIVDRYEFAHDGDLFSWIVKDIVVDKHLRLIGQLTTAPGIFIGPLFYYSLIQFFILFSQNCSTKRQGLSALFYKQYSWLLFILIKESSPQHQQTFGLSGISIV